MPIYEFFKPTESPNLELEFSTLYHDPPETALSVGDVITSDSDDVSGSLLSSPGNEEFSDVFHSPEVFGLSYAEMERKFKVYIYRDGDPKTYYQTPRKLTGKYASEGYFFQNIREMIMSDYYDLPFSDILDWHKFSVILREKDVFELKQILKNITQEEFVSLHNNLVKVQKHFQWNSPPIKLDAFHMVMYELWLRHHMIKY
nr:probable glycosyltransferase At5g03795 [Ipomoea batatas]